jgi:hypothetical protein
MMSATQAAWSVNWRASEMLSHKAQKSLINFRKIRPWNGRFQVRIQLVDATHYYLW